MSVHATVEIPSAAFVLEQTLTAHPALEIELERVVPLGEHPPPYLWVGPVAAAEARELLAQDSDVDAVTVLEQGDDEHLLEVTWTVTDVRFLDVLGATNGTCLGAVGAVESWELELRFPTHQRLAECYRECSDYGVDVTVQTVQNPGSSRAYDAAPVLTQRQRDALTTAFELGYFSVPRELTLQQLGDELGVSDTAASQRLRRGLDSLLGATLDRQR
jgi:hypothetical protein